jgi:hypothetical protein
MIPLPSHASHALQPLNVFCFKPFKITFRKVKDVVMFWNNHIEPNKITLTRWVDKALEYTLTRKKVKYGFRTTSIWPFNPKVMDGKTLP